MSKPYYNPANWYWIVAGDETRVWSSAAMAYVLASNDAYTAWLETGAHATRIASEEELQDVLSKQYPAGWPNLAIKAELAALDALLPRSLENYWEITIFDTSKLHANHLAILNQKKALRAEL